MNNIDKLIDSTSANLERILRWVYPGALFIGLLYASQPIFLKALYSEIHTWGLVAGGLVVGSIVYLFQSYVVGYVITVPLILLKWDVRQGLQKEPKGETTKPCYCRRCRCIERFFDRMAEATRDRWSDKVPEKVNNYLNYAWATYKAVLITGWLTLFFYLFVDKEKGSILHNVECWWIPLAASLLIVGGLFTYLLLSRIRLEDP
jgi:hypothetical protein